MRKDKKHVRKGWSTKYLYCLIITLHIGRTLSERIIPILLTEEQAKYIHKCKYNKSIFLKKRWFFLQQPLKYLCFLCWRWWCVSPVQLHYGSLLDTRTTNLSSLRPLGVRWSERQKKTACTLSGSSGASFPHCIDGCGQRSRGLDSPAPRAYK